MKHTAKQLGNKRIMDALQDAAVLPQVMANVLAELRGGKAQQIADPFNDKTSNLYLWSIYDEIKRVKQLKEDLRKLTSINEKLRDEIDCLQGRTRKMSCSKPDDDIVTNKCCKS